METTKIPKEQKREYNTIFHRFYINGMITVYSNMYAKEKATIQDTKIYLSYMNIVKKTAQLMQQMGIIEPFSICSVFEYLLWNGYFSKDKKLVYSMTARRFPKLIPGASIMSGKSACLNNVDMNVQILKCMGIEAYLFGANLKSQEKNITSLYKPAIRRRIKITEAEKTNLHSLWSKMILQQLGTHAVTLFKTKQGYYISDPTNLTFLNISDNLQAQFINNTVEVQLKPWLALILGYIKKEDFIKTIEDMHLVKHQPSLSLFQMQFIYENSINICQKNFYLLEDFYKEIQDDIETVNKQLLKNMR